MPTIKFITNGTACSKRSVRIFVFTFCIRSRIKNGRITVSGVLNMLSSFSNVSVFDFPWNESATSGDVPIIIAASSRLLQKGTCAMWYVAAVNKMSVRMVNKNMNLIVLRLNASNSFSRSRAVLSNTIIASANIARLLRNTSGNWTSFSP